MFEIEWRSNNGYGDFISGIGYAYASRLKYQQPVHINFHWPCAKDYLFSPKDPETIYERFEYIKDFLKPVDGVTFSHEFESVPRYRFINNLAEFDPLHGIWYPRKEHKIQKGLVAIWTTEHNLTHPGVQKDPVGPHWNTIKENLEHDGYQLVELTYRTPVKKLMKTITTCEFGVGYEGLAHQLFKSTWRPFIVFSRRVSLAKLLAAQGHVLTSPKYLLYDTVSNYIKESEKNIKRLKKQHDEYIKVIEDPTLHPLYNKEI